eukprot:361412-Chlamydomonas_euryale.AAC.7
MPGGVWPRRIVDAIVQHAHAQPQRMRRVGCRLLARCRACEVLACTARPPSSISCLPSAGKPARLEDAGPSWSFALKEYQRFVPATFLGACLITSTQCEPCDSSCLCNFINLKLQHTSCTLGVFAVYCALNDMLDAMLRHIEQLGRKLDEWVSAPLTTKENISELEPTHVVRMYSKLAPQTIVMQAVELAPPVACCTWMSQSTHSSFVTYLSSSWIVCCGHPGCSCTSHGSLKSMHVDMWAYRSFASQWGLE